MKIEIKLNPDSSAVITFYSRYTTDVAKIIDFQNNRSVLEGCTISKIEESF